jgi:hypothetical protein
MRETDWKVRPWQISFPTIFDLLHFTTSNKNPRIAFLDRDKSLYLVTKLSIQLFGSPQELVSLTGKPHYFFSDNQDVNEANAGSFVTMALSSGDTEVLKEFTKRMEEARTFGKPAFELVMPGLELEEMLLVFPSIAAEQVIFHFDVVGGNPRLFFSERIADNNSSYYLLVSELVGKIFPSQSSQNKQWAINIVCSALDTATKSISNDALDSSTFKDFEVSVSDEGVVKKGEVFSSRFMGLVASRIHRVCEESTKHSPRS